MLAIQLLQQVIWQIGVLLYSPVFWLTGVVVLLQTRQRARLKADFFQLRREPLGKTVLFIMAAGLSGGVLASGLLLLLGVGVDNIGLEYIWMIALLLLLVRQRFLCFAYSGGLLALSHWLVGWPLLDAAQLLALVAVLHITEAFLVLITGHLNALPVYLQDKQHGIIGGFVLQMVWPLPLVMLAGLQLFGTLPQAGFLLLPEWWPLLGGVEHDAARAGLFLLLPVLAALGYSDVAICHSIRQKTRQSATLLLLYSVALLLLVLLTRSIPVLQWVPALFAPLGHEAVIQYGRQQETQGTPRFTAPEQGVLVLDVQQGSPAARAGLRSEDWIIQLDGQAVRNRQDFLRRQYLLYGRVKVAYMRRGRMKQCRLHMKQWSQPGIITAPDGQCNIYWNLGVDEGFAKILYKKWVKRLKK